MKRAHHGSLPAWAWIALPAGTLFICVLCVCLGSVRIPAAEIGGAVYRALFAPDAQKGAFDAILLSVRLPRVLCAGLIGAALSVSGAAMQGLLLNPLADGSTLGVSSGASLGAAVALALGLSVPKLPWTGTAGMAMLFALLSLLMILFLSYRLDAALSTNTIILVGVILGMFASSAMSLTITFAGERAKTILFWTMGSLSGSGYASAALLLGSLAVFGGVLLGCANELNAFAISEENAGHVGVAVRKVKLLVMISCAGLIGVSVSVGGGIGFVGLAVPHAVRLVCGPDHRRLLPFCLFAGAAFLMLCDLVCRTIVSPLELPIGVMTSLIGSAVFFLIFWRSRKGA